MMRPKMTLRWHLTLSARLSLDGEAKKAQIEKALGEAKKAQTEKAKTSYDN